MSQTSSSLLKSEPDLSGLVTKSPLSLAHAAMARQLKLLVHSDMPEEDGEGMFVFDKSGRKITL